jgi:ketosteroid isomerase-like protein
MNPHEQLIEEFYAGFAAHDAKTMASCYHEDIEFSDPVFGRLKGDDVSDMWDMLIDRSKGNLVVEFSNIHANENAGSAKWTATYTFAATNRKVVNNITSTFEFKDDLIIKQTDSFDLWQWCRQALGVKGTLLGWSGMMREKIHKQALQSLRSFQKATASNS